MTSTRETFTTDVRLLECSAMSAPADDPDILLTDEPSKKPAPPGAPPTGDGNAPPPSSELRGVEVTGLSHLGGWSPAERGRGGVLPLLPCWLSRNGEGSEVRLSFLGIFGDPGGSMVDILRWGLGVRRRVSSGMRLELEL